MSREAPDPVDVLAGYELDHTKPALRLKLKLHEKALIEYLANIDVNDGAYYCFWEAQKLYAFGKNDEDTDFGDGWQNLGSFQRHPIRNDTAKALNDMTDMLKDPLHPVDWEKDLEKYSEFGVVFDYKNDPLLKRFAQPLYNFIKSVVEPPRVPGDGYHRLSERVGYPIRNILHRLECIEFKRNGSKELYETLVERATGEPQKPFHEWFYGVDWDKNEDQCLVITELFYLLKLMKRAIEETDRLVEKRMVGKTDNK